MDAQGRIYAGQMVGARVVRIDPADPEAQEVYAAIPDLPRCAIAPLAPCFLTTTDQQPWVNFVAFGPDGMLYVSDVTQATISRAPPGGGVAEPWYRDPRFEGYAPTGSPSPRGTTSGTLRAQRPRRGAHPAHRPPAAPRVGGRRGEGVHRRVRSIPGGDAAMRAAGERSRFPVDASDGITLRFGEGTVSVTFGRLALLEATT